MAKRFHCLFLATAFTCGVHAQPRTDVCEVSAALKDFQKTLYGPDTNAADRAGKIAEKLKEDPDNYFLKLWYLDTFRNARNDLISESRSQMHTHPNDVAYQYLYGRALVGRNTPAALKVFDDLARQAPQFPFTYISLMEIYASPNFRDVPKLTQSLQAFEKLCPASLNEFRYLRTVSDPDALKEASAHLRRLLDEQEKIGDPNLYTILWAAEFRATPPPQHDALRQQVAKDLERLKPLDDGKNTAALRTLAEGYKLVGDAEAAKAIEARQHEKSGTGAIYAYMDWMKAHPYKSGETPEQRWERSRELLKATETWIQKWPNDSSAWETRLTALTSQKEKPPVEEVEKVGDKILELAAANPGRNSSYPPKLRVAETWARYDIRLKDLPDMLEEGLKQAAAFGSGNDNDLYKRNDAGPSPDSNTRFFALTILFDVAMKLKQLDRAHKALNEMSAWLDANKAMKNDEKPYVAQPYARNESFYMTRMGTMAAAEDHKVDALAYYQKAFLSDTPDGVAMMKARDLWKEQGGSNEGWKLWSAKLEPPKSKVAPAPMTAEIQWKKLDRPLPEMKLFDFAGKTWTITDLKGKTTLINVWATWCGPCKDELPHFEKLYNQMKDRKDLEIITFNVDEEPGLIEPFLKANKFTFPVLLAKSYFEEIVPQWSIPRNWVVDKAGTLRLETTGFGGDGEKWLKQVAARLNEPLE